jgi:NAD+ synthase
MQVDKRIDYIKNWISEYCKSMLKEPDSLVVGISGGVDSSVTSTLCALTGKRTIVLSMPIRQIKEQHDLSIGHQKWLKKKFKNVDSYLINLDLLFETFKSSLSKFDNEHGMANARARLRMTTLYQVAAANNGIVVGTGNKVEDFGVGFYTKYGDGGVDISPLADCTKTQVWEMGEKLGILEDIVKADPTDGLWEDGRADVSQLGMSYQDLEKAMIDSNNPGYKKYLEIRKKNLHKMNPIPVCKMKNEK